MTSTHKDPMRPLLRPPFALCAAAALALAGCAAQPEDPGPPAPEPTANPVDPGPGDDEPTEPTEPEEPDGDPDDATGPDDEAPDGAVVSVYFTNPDRGADDEWSEPYAVERTVPAPDVLRGALEALLEGPTPDEEAEGYESWFSAETSGLLNSVELEDGTAYVDFDATLRDVIPNASTSSGSRLLLTQLSTTATQFPTVDEAIYSLDGDVDGFYLWLQMSPPDEW